MGTQLCSVEIDHARVHYQVAGPETGRPVVLLHGASFSAKNWHEIGTIELLSKRGYRSIAADLPGFGQSEPADGQSTTVWLKRFLRAAAIEMPVVVSPSMSGRFSLPFARDNSEMLAGLVVVAPVGIPHYMNNDMRIECRLLIVWGGNDRLIPIEQSDQLLEAASNGRRVVLEGAGHAAYMEKTDEFHAELLKFLDECSTDSTLNP